MAAPTLPDNVLARYRRLMLGGSARIPTEGGIGLLGAAREYLAAVSEMRLSSEADLARERKVHV